MFWVYIYNLTTCHRYEVGPKKVYKVYKYEVWLHQNEICYSKKILTDMFW